MIVVDLQFAIVVLLNSGAVGVEEGDDRAGLSFSLVWHGMSLVVRGHVEQRRISLHTWTCHGVYRAG